MPHTNYFNFLLNFLSELWTRTTWRRCLTTYSPACSGSESCTYPPDDAWVCSEFTGVPRPGRIPRRWRHSV